MLFLSSHAKLNLYLQVLGIRKDRYHNIKTIFERVSLCDRIILKPRRDKIIKVACNAPGVPADKENLAYRSAKLLQDAFKVDSGVEIKITKRIPVGAGLGGGSSNAATVLMGLNRLWRLNLSRDKLVNFARKIGSDVSFFIYDSRFAQGRGRGDRIEPLAGLKQARFWHILIVPKIKVPTPLIYKEWDKFKKGGLTKPNYNVKILTLALRKKDLALTGKALFNDLERVTTRLYPQVRHIRERLTRMAVKSILMSGSGPAVFGIVSSRKEAEAIKRLLKKKSRVWQVFVTRTH